MDAGYIKELQEILTNAGFYKGVCNGVTNKETEKAALRFIYENKFGPPEPEKEK